MDNISKLRELGDRKDELEEEIEELDDKISNLISPLIREYDRLSEELKDWEGLPQFRHIFDFRFISFDDFSFDDNSPNLVKLRFREYDNDIREYDVPIEWINNPSILKQEYDKSLKKKKRSEASKKAAKTRKEKALLKKLKDKYE